MISSNKKQKHHDLNTNVNCLVDLVAKKFKSGDASETAKSSNSDHISEQAQSDKSDTKSQRKPKPSSDDQQHEHKSEKNLPSFDAVW